VSERDIECERVCGCLLLCLILLSSLVFALLTRLLARSSRFSLACFCSPCLFSLSLLALLTLLFSLLGFARSPPLLAFFLALLLLSLAFALLACFRSPHSLSLSLLVFTLLARSSPPLTCFCSPHLFSLSSLSFALLACLHSPCSLSLHSLLAILLPLLALFLSSLGFALLRFSFVCALLLSSFTFSSVCAREWERVCVRVCVLERERVMERV